MSILDHAELLGLDADSGYYRLDMVVRQENGGDLTWYCAPDDWATSEAAREIRELRTETIADLRARLAELETQARRDATAAKLAALEPCPHCDMPTFTSRLSRTQHVRFCASNPDREMPGRYKNRLVEARVAAAEVAAALPAPDPETCPFCQVGPRSSMHMKYCKANPDRTLPPGSREARALRAAARAPEAVPEPDPAPFSPPATVVMPGAPPEQSVAADGCPFCGEVFEKPRALTSHVRVCPSNPDRVVPVGRPPAVRIPTDAADEPVRRAYRRPAAAFNDGSEASGYQCPRCQSRAFAPATHGRHCQKCERDDRLAVAPMQATAWGGK